LMERGAWQTREELSDAVLLAGGWAYSTVSPEGCAAPDAFRRRLQDTDLVLQNQDNREQDLFDASDYFEFQGGLVNAVTVISAAAPSAYVGDSSDPDRPQVRTLQSEALRVFRARVVNPKWLGAMQAHGYRGGLELAATVDALLGFSATSGVVSDWMFEDVAEQYAGGATRRFLERENPWALNAIVERLLEAEQRGLWQPRAATLEALRASFLDSETLLEAVAENPA
jgi:cobaltochelatase CobN